MGMSVPEPKRFPTAAGYGSSDPGSFVSQNQQPLYAPPEQFASLSTPSASPAASATTTAKVQAGNVRGMGGKRNFFDQEFDDNPILAKRNNQNRQGGLPSPILPPPVKLPHDVGYF